jgi:hypothetical protein
MPWMSANIIGPFSINSLISMATARGDREAPLETLEEE